MTTKGLAVLTELASHFVESIEIVVIGTDSSLSDDSSKDIISLCKSKSLPFCFKGAELQLGKNTYVFAAGWRWLIKHPSDKLIIFHDSILPRFRGYAPLINMLIIGEREIGVTALFGSDAFDSGDIICQERTAISYPIKIAEAISINNKNYSSIAKRIATMILDGREIIGVQQISEEATYSLWRDNEDFRIDWAQTADQIKRFVDALGTPYSGAKTRMQDGTLLIIKEVEIIDSVKLEIECPGKVLFIEKGSPIVCCGEGLLKLTSVTKVNIDQIETNFLPLTQLRTRFN